MNQETTNLNGQPHYNGWDAFAKMQDLLGENPELLLGNVIKYVYRYDKKGTPLQDLEKAKVYLDKKLENHRYKSSNKTITIESLLCDSIFEKIKKYHSSQSSFYLSDAKTLIDLLITQIQTRNNVSQT